MYGWIISVTKEGHYTDQFSDEARIAQAKSFYNLKHIDNLLRLQWFDDNANSTKYSTSMDAITAWRSKNVMRRRFEFNFPSQPAHDHDCFIVCLLLCFFYLPHEFQNLSCIGRQLINRPLQKVELSRRLSVLDFTKYRLSLYTLSREHRSLHKYRNSTFFFSRTNFRIA